MTDTTRVVDSHVHFWNPVAGGQRAGEQGESGDLHQVIPSEQRESRDLHVLHYPWLDSLPALRRSLLPANYAAVADAFIVVEANCISSEAELEVDFVHQLAAQDDRIAGVVAFVDLGNEESRDGTLSRLSQRDRVVGVRQNIQGHAKGFCLTPSFVGGVHNATALGFTFDVCITADQLDDAIELVRRCPDTQFILDHCAKPAIRDEAFAPWAAGIEYLAAFETVSCKLSGLLSEARPEQRNADALCPYVDHVRDCFGPTRLLFGSDWPVCTLAGGDALWRTIVGELTADWSPIDRRAMYADNATRLYGMTRHADR